MTTITTDELRIRLDEGRLAIFDTRGDIEYENGHIPGAKTAPLGSLSFRVRSLMNPDTPIVVYSNGGDCPLAADASRRLENLGMRDVFCYADGIKGWQAAGQEIIESVNPKAHARGEFTECRSVTVDRDRAYGGIFKIKPTEVGGAGG
jgi:rhodanese-related sulfurtransferase